MSDTDSFSQSMFLKNRIFNHDSFHLVTMVCFSSRSEKNSEGDGFYQTRLWFRDCIDIFAEEGYALKQPIVLNLENRSSYDLYLKPSGLCQNALFCAYQDCTPPEACPELMRTEIQQLAETPEVVTALLHKCPPDNLPATVLKAENVKDVIHGIALAKHWRTSVSVKTSGHSYAGSSTFQRSVLINRARYQKYARENVLECGTLPNPIPPALNNAKNVCDVAAARGKQAVIRVGGGENWNEVYAVAQQQCSAERLFIRAHNDLYRMNNYPTFIQHL